LSLIKSVSELETNWWWTR